MITKFALSSELIVITYICQALKTIWTANHGSDPKQKPDFRVTDPTPKENLVKEPQIPPEENLGWESRAGQSYE